MCNGVKLMYVFALMLKFGFRISDMMRRLMKLHLVHPHPHTQKKKKNQAILGIDELVGIWIHIYRLPLKV